jgi:hypothetical protein
MGREFSVDNAPETRRFSVEGASGLSPIQRSAIADAAWTSIRKNHEAANAAWKARQVGNSA